MINGIISLFFLFFFFSVSFGQLYPYWFIYPAKVGCDDYEIGYAATGYFKDSSKVVAFKNGCVNYTRNTEVKIEGEQGFWKTETGNYWMGARINETFDTASVHFAEANLKLISSFVRDNFTIVLLCNLSNNFDTVKNKVQHISDFPTPAWITQLPNTDNFIYSIGMTPEYFYETSSWIEAERLARINLAKQLSIKIQSLQKFSGYNNQEIKNEEFSVTLNNISVVERWVDAERKIFYVLVRMPL